MLASRFSVRNRDLLRELFALLGLTYSTDPKANADLAMESWYGEHRKPVTNYPLALLKQIIELATVMQLVGESIPERVVALSRMNNPGGRQRAMTKRFRLLKRLEDAGGELGEFLTWAGQRLRDTKPGSGECLHELTEFIENERLELLEHPWVKAQLKLDNTNPDRFQRPFATETEIVILCALVVYGNDLQLVHRELVEEAPRILRCGPDDQTMVVPGRTVLYHRFWRKGRPDIIVFNGEAVERRRPNGEYLEPRPTTHSTTIEVADEFGFDGVQGIMLSNPHAWRMALEIDHFVRGAGHNPTFVVYELAGADTHTEGEVAQAAITILGEIARILRNELEHM